MAGKRLVFSEATPFFAAAVALLHQRCFTEPWPETAMKEILAMPGVFCLIAGDSGEDAAGFVICRLAADECEIISIGVIPERRRSGIATALLSATLARAQNLGAKSAFIEVAADNQAAAGLYRRHGFARVGGRPDYYRRRDGRADALIMARKL